MRAALLITLVAFGSFAQGRFDRFNARTSQGRSTRGFEQSNYAFSEFAPSSGAGMGTACACTTPTSAKGDALTFTRTGDATCSKQGLATTGIANGDLVVCTANQPRVESSGGVLGLRVEGARTNVLPRSQELDNAAWILDFAGGGVIPTRTANAATAPDGTVTAERLQFSACASAGDASLIYQLHATSGASASTIFCRGNGSTVTISVCSFGSTGSSGCTPVSCPSTSWSRGQDIRTASGTGGLVVGCNNLVTYTGASNTGAADVFLWQAQQEMGATYATSPITTVASAVTRNLEDATVPSVSIAGLASTGCVRAYVARPTGATNGTAVSFSDGSGRPLYFTAGNQTVFDGTNNPNLATTFNGSSKWYITRWTGSSFTLHNQDTAAATTAFDGTMGVTGPLQLGNSVTNLQADGIVSRVQVDPSPTRCAP